jgi:hypothetical protein
LADHCEDTIEVVDLVARVGPRGVRDEQALLFSFLRHAGFFPVRLLCEGV